MNSAVIGKKCLPLKCGMCAKLSQRLSCNSQCGPIMDSATTCRIGPVVMSVAYKVLTSVRVVMDLGFKLYMSS